MTKKLKLKRAMNTFYAIAVIIPMIIIGMLSLNHARSYLFELSKDYNSQIIDNLKLNIENFFKDPVDDLNTLRAVLETDADDVEFESKYNNDFIMKFYENQDMFHHILIIDNNGTVKYHYPESNSIIGFDYSNKPAYAAIKDGAESAWSETYMYIRENKISINYAIPIGDDVLLGIIHLDLIKTLFDNTVNDESIIVGLTDNQNRYIVHSDYTFVEQQMTDFYVSGEPLEYDLVSLTNEEYYATTADVDYLGWSLILYDPVERIQGKIQSFVIYIGIIILIILFVSVLIGLRLNDIIISSLNKVLSKTKEVRAGRYTLKNEDSVFAEFNEITENFAAMVTEIQTRENQILQQNSKIEHLNRDLEKRVVTRTDELYSANQELEIALENLKLTQTQLIESEKLASLGDLVAGLAHEINTPLGIILTVVTYMQETTKQMKSLYDSGKLKKSDFENHLNGTLESEGLIYDNINRAIELISSFKLISAEQRNVEKRDVELHDFMHSIIRSVQPQLKKSNVEAKLHIDHEMVIETVPISLYQIIVNLVMNSKLHAYENTSGIVDIFVTENNMGVEIIVQDYGSGISAENINKIFDPFFTTKRGSGGTGLGLNIVYNTIRQNLQGEIRCYSEENVGTQFIISLPKSI